MGMTVLTEKACLRCGHIWWPRTPERPVTCPKCNSPYWDKPREDKGEKVLSQEPR